jgi:hypothetical protein
MVSVSPDVDREGLLSATSRSVSPRIGSSPEFCLFVKAEESGRLKALLVLASGGDFGVNQDTRVVLTSPVHAREPLCPNGMVCVPRIRFAERVVGRTVIGLLHTRAADRACGCDASVLGFGLCAWPWCWRKNRIISAEELGPCESV